MGISLVKCKLESLKTSGFELQIDTAKEIDKERSDRRRPANGSRQGQLSRQSTEERGTEQKPASPVVAPVENGVNGRPEEKDVVPPIQNARFPGASRRNSQNQRRDNFEGDRNQRRENFNGERRNSRRSDNSYGPEDARHLNEELPRGDTEDATQVKVDYTVPRTFGFKDFYFLQHLAKCTFLCEVANMRRVIFLFGTVFFKALSSPEL